MRPRLPRPPTVPPPPLVAPAPHLTPVPVELGRSAWGADLVDPGGNRWSICSCHHLDRDAALRCARAHLERRARTAFEAYTAAITRVYGQETLAPLTWDQLPLSAQDAWIAAAESLRRDP